MKGTMKSHSVNRKIGRKRWGRGVRGGIVARLSGEGRGPRNRKKNS